MGTAGIKIKIMPTSPDVNLENIKKQAKELIEKKGGKNREYEEEPIAFGLKAIIAFFELSEDIESGKIEEELNSIEGVSSAKVIDMRKLL